MKDLFQTVIEKLTNQDAIDLFTDRELTPVKYVDLYKGQYLNLQMFDVTPLPAIFFQWTKNHDTNIANIGIHLVYELVRDTSSRSEAQDKALKFFDYLNTVDELLFGLESVNTGKFERSTEEPILLDTVAISHQINYTCSFDEPYIEKFDWTNGDGEVQLEGSLRKSIPPVPKTRPFNED